MEYSEYSEFITGTVTEAEALNAAKKYNNAGLRAEKVLVLSSALNIPRPLAYQLLVTKGSKTEFARMAFTAVTESVEGEAAAKAAISAKQTTESGETLPVLYSFFAYRVPKLFFMAQGFLNYLEDRGYNAFAFFMNTGAEGEVFLAMQQYGWKVSEVVEMDKYVPNLAPHKAAAVVIRKQ